MRAVVQRVTRARVTVGAEEVGRIDSPGLCVLVGVTHDDHDDVAAALAHKVIQLRILHGERSALDLGAPVLVVSQFTLYADTRRGRRPSWQAAAPAAVAQPLVDVFVDRIRSAGLPVATGRFGADMAVELVNDGPVTVIVEL